MKRYFLLLACLLIFAACDKSNESQITPEINLIDKEVLLGCGSNLTKQVKFSSNVPWVIELSNSSLDWFDINPKEGYAGDIILTISTTKTNESYDDRSSSFTINAAHISSEPITITQKKTNAILISGNKIELGIEDDGFSVEVQSNVSYQIIIPEESKSWISKAASPLSRGLDSSAEYFSVTAPIESGREGSVIFKYENIEETVEIIQAQKKYIKSEETLDVDEKKQTIEVVVTANIEYNVIMPEGNWIKELTSSQENNIIIHSFEVTAHTTGPRDRTATIIFKSKTNDLTTSIKIIQTRPGIFTSEDLYEWAKSNKSSSNRDDTTLKKFGNYDENTSKWTFTLENDINLNSTITFDQNGNISGGTPTAWSPVGLNNNIFDGQGFTISGMYFEKTSYLGASRLGFFSSLSSKAIVQNLNIGLGKIVNSYSGGTNIIGGIVGEMQTGSKVINCNNYCVIEDKSSSGSLVQLGGICGQLYEGIIDGCSNYGNIRGAGSIGGICNATTSTALGVISNCSNYGHLTGTDNNRWVGGIVCSNSAGAGSTIKNCINEGLLSNSKEDGVIGGISAFGSGLFIACINKGVLTATGLNAQVGGIYGGVYSTSNPVQMIACYNVETVNASLGYAGGLAGKLNDGTSFLIASYNYGRVNGKYGGGIVGSGTPHSQSEDSALWIETSASKRIGNITGTGDNIDKKSSAELQTSSTTLNTAISTWNIANPAMKCNYEFYGIIGEYPQLRKK